MAEIALGFCTSSAKLIEFPGWPPKPIAPNVQSWAYHGDDGGFYASDTNKWPQQYGKHYGPGDTVGCGLEVDSQRIFFTRNGVRIGKGGLPNP
jgi:Ran-binding protein 9/10